ncbi:MAG: UPF0280 family protein [Hadesarchaea archaeon CG08_land_8_20_14_0_20_51_8]|nr:MAG: UPF0280 family protein [Hadesarchaea archaeon CG08_land_8_20_14_0_20_51_8]
MYVRTWSLKETNLLIKCDEERGIDAAIEASLRARGEIERFIRLHPEFRWSLEPLKLNGSHPKVIELMLRAGELAEVGPFAAVAGAISQVAAEATLTADAKNVLIENGGDIAIMGNQDFRIGVFAGDAKGSGKIGFHIQAGELPIGICTSSGTIGHSISFGDADAVVAIAREASVADAAATSIANAVKGEEVKSSIGFGLDRAKHIPEILGCLIVREDQIGTWGKLPELILLSPKSQELSEISKRYKNYGLELTPVL